MTDLNALKARTVELLAALGDNQQQVADRLLEGGHFGKPGDCGACPIAVYLMRCDLHPDCVDVTDETITIFLSSEPFGDFVKVHTPEPVIEFITGFDTGAHDELVATDGGPA